MRVQIPAYTDRWMMGDRFGQVLKVYRKRNNAHGEPEKEVARVKLDLSGKVMLFWLGDCTEV